MQTECSGVSTSALDMDYSSDGSCSDTNTDEFIASSDSSCFSMDQSDEVGKIDMDYA